MLLLFSSYSALILLLFFPSSPVRTWAARDCSHGEAFHCIRLSAGGITDAVERVPINRGHAQARCR